MGIYRGEKPGYRTVNPTYIEFVFFLPYIYMPKEISRMMFTQVFIAVISKW